MVHSNFEIRRDVTRGRYGNPKTNVLPQFHKLHERFMVTCLKYTVTSRLISKLNRVYSVSQKEVDRDCLDF